MNCPTCDQPGKRVDTQTPKGVLKTTLEILDKGNPYFYCKSEACDVAYFHENGIQLIYENDLRVPVYHKHPSSPDTSICYCFEITVGKLEEDFNISKGDNLIGRINEGIKKGQCACDIRNPEGVCCLGNVKLHLKSKSMANEIGVE